MFENILVEKDGPIGVIRLNRPRVLNALNRQLMREVSMALDDMEKDENIRVVILTGNERAFAAGADVSEFRDPKGPDMLFNYRFFEWERVATFLKPLVASVAGYALGGGFELAMMCDMIVAADNAVFGQPEIKLGIIPGAGGTQRLTRLIEKHRAMEYILTGKFMDVWQAYRMGVVNRVVPVENYLKETKRFIRDLVDGPPIALAVAKDTVNKAYELNLREGLDYERKMFYFLFSTRDKDEGISAFLEKRKPEFKGR